MVNNFFPIPFSFYLNVIRFEGVKAELKHMEEKHELSYGFMCDFFFFIVIVISIIIFISELEKAKQSLIIKK